MSVVSLPLPLSLSFPPALSLILNSNVLIQIATM